MNTRAFMGALLALLASQTLASTTPRPGIEDPRIQTVDYDAAQVVTLRVALGYVLTLEFSPDERIQNVAVGNSGAWQVTPSKSADHLFVKPTEGGVQTDMTVITDARSYNFDLESVPGPSPSIPFIVRILYPPPTNTVEDTQPEISFYRFTGSKALHPVAMRDDGHATFIIWSPNQQIPAVFKIDAQGRKSLVNGALRGDEFVIDETAPQFIFELANQQTLATRHLINARKK